MVNVICPCKDCVPPKRAPGCHSICQEYRDWKTACEAVKAKSRELKKEDDDLFIARFGIRRKR